MADPRGFLKHGREGVVYRPVETRLGDYASVQENFPLEKTQLQASRCMDCGIPFCNNGCPLGNIIPDFNDLVYRDKWEDALARLHSTNNFPEFTGMVCPAPCEQACVLGINQDPVTIKQVEWEIIRKGWDEGWVRADVAPQTTLVVPDPERPEKTLYTRPLLLAEGTVVKLALEAEGRIERVPGSKMQILRVAGGQEPVS